MNQPHLTCLLLNFTLAGHNEQLVTTAEKEKGISFNDFSCLTGYSQPDTWKPRENTGYDCPVIDKRAILESNLNLSWESPMPCAVKAQCKPLSEAGPMDFISLEDYLMWWRNKGANIGHVMPNGVIIWHNGEIQKKKLDIFARIALANLSYSRKSDYEITLFVTDDSGKRKTVYDGSGYGAWDYLDSLNIPTHA